MPLTTEDHARLDLGRLRRLQESLAAADCGAALLTEPLNIRYATGTARSTLWNLHGATRYALVPVTGLATLFDNPSAHHVYGDRAAVGEYRPAISTCFWTAGPNLAREAAASAADIATLLRAAAGGNRTLAVDRLDRVFAEALAAEGIALQSVAPLLEPLRAVKLSEEVALIRRAVEISDMALAQIRDDLTPGITEIELWSRLSAVNAAHGGEWVETRLLSSGSRTNPWYQEASDRVIQAGDLVGVDTDMIGPYGYLSDISRTMLCGDGPARDEQRDLFALAYEQLQTNIELIRPGAAFREVSEKSWRLPERFQKHAYLCVAHGAGMCNEYPNIVLEKDLEAAGYDGVVEENMVFCVESYLGDAAGGEGVKLEEQVLVTERGAEVLSRSPFDERLLA